MRPRVLIAKITISTISGARIRRMIRKMGAEAVPSADIGTRQRGARRTGSVANRRYQNSSSGLLKADRLTAME